MDKLKAMQIAVAIADGGSLTAAADSLDVSLPVVVRTLAALEAGLGVRLFNRSTRRLSLTDEGRDYLARCRQILADIAEAEAALASDAVVPSGRVVVTAPVMFGQQHVAPALTRFVQHYGQMRVELRLHDRVVNLLEEHIDVAVRIGAIEDQSLVAHALGTLRRIVVASPAYLDARGTPQHPRELAAHECIVFNGNSASWWRFVEDGHEFGMTVDGRLTYNHVAPALDACRAGMGLGTFIAYQIADDLRAGRLLPVLEAFELPPRPVHVAFPHARLLPTRTRVLVDWLRRDLGEQLAAL